MPSKMAKSPNTIVGWRTTAIQKLKAAGIESADLDSRLLLEFVIGANTHQLLSDPDKQLNTAQNSKLAELLSDRLNHKPLAYITGNKEFYGREFTVNEQVLVPRPESEAIVEYALKQLHGDQSVLDLGTGSGCLAISIKLGHPGPVFGSDISKSALQVAKHNAKKLAADVDFINSDLFDQINGKFDLIIANLPYLPDTHFPAELKHEPKVALFSGSDGLGCYHDFFSQVDDFLKPKAQIIIEHLPRQKEQLRQLTSYRHLSISPFVSVFKN